MNDNLEFRAWDRVNKHMIVDSPLSMATIMGNYVGKKIDFNGKSLVENYEIMQFIWRRDINGVKIFMGDIVQECYGSYKNERKPYAVDDIFEIYYAAEARGCSFEIIGNIYENPELLESDHE